MYNRQLKAEDRILKSRVLIMNDPRFIAIAGVMMIGQWSVSDAQDMPNGQKFTAYTTGKETIFGRKFVDGLTDAQLRFLILHETYHLMFMHMTVWRHLFDENPRFANIAADIVINNSLDHTAGHFADNFIEFIEGGALDHQYDGMDTGEVYRALLANAQQQQQQQQQDGDGDGDGKTGAKGYMTDEAQEIDGHGMSDDDMPMSDEELADLQEQVDTALRQGAQMAGKMGGSVDRTIADLMNVTVDWREVLRDFVRTNAAGDDLSTWRRPNRRWMARDIYMPSRYTEAVKRVVIGLDTSGSIGINQLRRAMTEVKGVFDVVMPECVDLIYWDSSVAGHETYDSASFDQIINVTKPVGGGGTRAGCVKDYLDAKGIKPDCILMFTDGYVERDWGGDNWPAPILWCVSEKHRVAPTGKTLYVPA